MNVDDKEKKRRSKNMETYSNLRPVCSSCKKEFKGSPSITKSGEAIFYCSECGVILAMKKEK